MLVLSRKPGQSLIIGENIVLTVLEVEGDRVKIGVEAPREVAILRGELHAEMRYENWLARTAGTQADRLVLPIITQGRAAVGLAEKAGLRCAEEE